MQNLHADPKVHQEWLDNLRSSPRLIPARIRPRRCYSLGWPTNCGEEHAKEWYGQIAANSRVVAGSQGRRSDTPRLVGNETVSRARASVRRSTWPLPGKVVVIQYWASWCEPCKADMAALKDLAIRYGKSGFQVIGVNVDSSLQEMKSYLTQNPLPWQQIHEQGGLDSRPANELGIHTLPTMILVDQGGKVVNRNVHVAELDSELRKLIR